MNKKDYSVLLLMSVLIALLVAANLGLGYSNGNLSNELNQQQMIINNARQMEPVLDNLAKRIAKGSEKDTRLREILKKNDLQVTLDTASGKKQYP